jgi:hypothetical protein
MPLHCHRRSLSILLPAVCCLAALSGCGSSDPAKKSASNQNQQGIEFADCMRSHGVPNFPDPPAGGGGKVSVQSSSGINPFSPAFQAAQSACRRFLPSGGPGSGHPSAASRAQMLAASHCMRTHGISGFPDPTTTPPTSTSGYSAILGTHGVFFAIPTSIDANSPAFKQAATACHLAPTRGR